jgi:hypothetical protein
LHSLPIQMSWVPIPTDWILLFHPVSVAQKQTNKGLQLWDAEALLSWTFPFNALLIFFFSSSSLFLFFGGVLVQRNLAAQPPTYVKKTNVEWFLILK